MEAIVRVDLAELAPLLIGIDELTTVSVRCLECGCVIEGPVSNDKIQKIIHCPACPVPAGMPDSKKGRRLFKVGDPQSSPLLKVLNLLDEIRAIEKVKIGFVILRSSKPAGVTAGAVPSGKTSLPADADNKTP
jgi:hypothetical protein